MRVRAAIRSFLLATLVGVVGLAWVTSVLAAPGDRATPMRQAIVQCLQEFSLITASGGLGTAVTADAAFENGATVSISGNIAIKSTSGSIQIGSTNGAGTYLGVSSTDAILYTAGGLAAMTDDDSHVNVAVDDTTNDVTVKADNEEIATFSGAGLTVTAGNTVSAPTLASTVSTGTAPFTLTSTTVSTNLNADLLDGHDTAYFVAEGAWTTWTVSGNSWVSNATHTGVSRHRGKTLELELNIVLSGAPTSANLVVDIPAGFTIDSAAFAGGTLIQDYSLGTGYCYDASATSTRLCQVRCEDADSIGVYAVTTQPNIMTSVTQAVPFTFATSDLVRIRCTLPVTTAAAP